MKKHILVCSKKKPEGIPCCHARGGMELADGIRAELFKRGLENEYHVTTTGCLGICNRGPAMVVYPEGKWYTEFKREEIQSLVDQHLIADRQLSGRTDPAITQIEAEIAEHQQYVKKSLVEKGLLP